MQSRTKRDGYGTGVYLLVLAFLLGGIVASHAQKVTTGTIIIYGAGEIETTVIEYPNGDMSLTSISEKGDVVLFSFKDGLTAFGFTILRDKNYKESRRFFIIYQERIVGRLYLP